MEDFAYYDSTRVAIEKICSDLCEIKDAKICDIQKHVETAVLHRSGLKIRFQRVPNFGRCFPKFTCPWYGNDRTLIVTLYANGNEDHLANNSQYYFEQLSIGVVLAHLYFVADCLTPSVTLQSFRKDYPQLAILGDRICDILKEILSDR